MAYDTTELLYLSFEEFLPDGFDDNFDLGVQPGNATGAPYPNFLTPPDPQHEGVVGSWEAVNLFSPPVSGIFNIGTVSFKVIGQGTGDGNDILAGLFNNGVDGIIDADDNPIDPALIQFGHVDVNVVPEPASLILLATGLAGIASIRRKR